MEGGEVGGNTAYGGGGAFIGRGTFIKQIGGIIYGPDAGGLLRNTATRGDSYGHVVYASGSPAKKRNGTVGTEAVLDSTSADGWD
jgi:hypothetical protein